MAELRAVEVFTPSDYPVHTYVSRDEARLEKRLRDALETPGEVVSVSGPSKSGKTVLVERVVGPDDLITITGAGIRSPEQLWDRVLDWMDVPVGSSGTKTLGATGSGSVTTKGEAGIPLVAKAGLEGSVGGSVSGRGQPPKLALVVGWPKSLKRLLTAAWFC